MPIFALFDILLDTVFVTLCLYVPLLNLLIASNNYEYNSLFLFFKPHSNLKSLIRFFSSTTFVTRYELS